MAQNSYSINRKANKPNTSDRISTKSVSTRSRQTTKTKATSDWKTPVTPQHYDHDEVDKFSPTSPDKDHYKPSCLRSLITILEELKELDLDTAKSQYKQMMMVSQKSLELRQEDKYLEERKKRLDNSFDSLERAQQIKELQALQKEKGKLQDEKERLVETLNQYKALWEALESKYTIHKDELQAAKDELKTKDKALSIALKEKNDALTRLSKEMGTKLNDNNPAIADLSDPNRATKIAEKYNELYDNQWTDAMEGLTNYFDEREAINNLLQTFKLCYTVCSKTASKQLESLHHILKAPHIGSLTSGAKWAWSPPVGGTGSPDSRVARSTNKMLKECRKLMAEEAIKGIFKDFTEQYSSEVSLVDPSFVKKCIELCWMMVVQDPPVAIGKEAVRGEKFDSEMYREYTASGTIIEYTVWLPLLLHENGPLLCKGVAQPDKTTKVKTRSKSAPPSKRRALPSGRPDKTTSPPENRTNISKTYRKFDNDRNPSTASRFDYRDHTDSSVPRNYEHRVVQTKVDKSPRYNDYETDVKYSPSSKAFTHEKYSDDKVHRSRTATSPDLPEREKFTIEYTPHGKSIVYYKVESNGVKYARYGGKLYYLDKFREAYGLSGWED